jgi:hypothetical protein
MAFFELAQSQARITRPHSLSKLWKWSFPGFRNASAVILVDVLYVQLHLFFERDGAAVLDLPQACNARASAEAPPQPAFIKFLAIAHGKRPGPIPSRLRAQNPNQGGTHTRTKGPSGTLPSVNSEHISSSRRLP